MAVPLTSNEKLQLYLFKLMNKKATSFLRQDAYNKDDIACTKNQCLLLAIRKMCQVYIDLQGNTKKNRELKRLIISYFKIIYHSDIPKKIKTVILKFLKAPSAKRSNDIIAAIYALHMEDFSLYILSSLITHINRKNPQEVK